MTLVVDFLRHGETERPRALLGQTDVDLSPKGRSDIARQVKDGAWAEIICSPLIRAVQSAEIAARNAGCNAEIDTRWAEIDFGEWDGRDLSELQSDPTVAASLNSFYEDPTKLSAPGGEAYEDVNTRVNSALTELLDRQGPILVVAHGGTIRIALARLLGIHIAKLWAIRIECATRLRLTVGQHPRHGLWGELTEIAQP